MNPFDGSKPSPALSPTEFTQTNSGSISMLAISSFAKTRSPIWEMETVSNKTFVFFLAIVIPGH